MWYPKNIIYWVSGKNRGNVYKYYYAYECPTNCKPSDSFLMIPPISWNIE